MASASASSKGAKPRSGDKPTANRAAQDKLTPTKPPPQKRRLKVQGAKANGSKADASKALPAKAPSLKLRAAKAPSAKAHAFLVAVKRRREALRVYAVQTASEAVALAIVEAASAEDATVEPVGRLSKKLAAPLKLLTGEPRLI